MKRLARWLRRFLGFTRPPREVYVRTSRVHGRRTIEPGVEFRPGDDFHFVTGMLHDICSVTAGSLCPTLAEEAERAGSFIEEVWPDRAYFVEVHSNEGWIQIFQPYGVPKNGG